MIRYIGSRSGRMTKKDKHFANIIVKDIKRIPRKYFGQDYVSKGELYLNSLHFITHIRSLCFHFKNIFAYQEILFYQICGGFKPYHLL